MKQIKEALDRAFENKQPLKKKWKAFIEWQQDKQTYYLYIFHYHHLILVYDIKVQKSIYEWWERKADKRGLMAAKKYLEERQENVETSN